MQAEGEKEIKVEAVEETEEDENTMDELAGEADDSASTRIMERPETTRKRRSTTEAEPVLYRISASKTCECSDLIHISKDHFKIGRKSDNDEVFTSPLISRKHCSIQRDEETGNWSVTNLSSCDTLLNGNSIMLNQTKPLKHGDILQFSLAEVFKYEFMMFKQEPERAKCSKIETTEKNLKTVVDGMRLLVQWQVNQRESLTKQLIDKHAEQEQLHKELRVAKEYNDKLSNKIIELHEKINIGNVKEMKLQQKYQELLEKLKEERFKFADVLATKEYEWQEKQNELKQDNDNMKMMHAHQMEKIEKQLIEIQVEFQNICNSLQVKKNIEAQLRREKHSLTQKLTALQENMKKKEQSVKTLEQIRNALLQNKQIQSQKQQKLHKTWQKKESSLLQEKKNIQNKLQNENKLLEKKFKALQEDLKKKEYSIKVQEQIKNNLLQKKQTKIEQQQKTLEMWQKKTNNLAQEKRNIETKLKNQNCFLEQQIRTMQQKINHIEYYAKSQEKYQNYFW